MPEAAARLSGLARRLGFWRPRAAPAADPVGDIIVCRAYRFLYCPVPKSANSSFKAWIRKLEGHPDIGAHLHDPERNGLTRLGTLPPDEQAALLADPAWVRFVVVRNPFARLFAAWVDKFAPKADGSVAMPALAAKLRARHAERFGRAPGEGLSFRMFVELVGTEDPAAMDPHWRPQVLIAVPDRVAYDPVIRMENLRAAGREIAKRVGAPFPMTLHRHRRTPAGTQLSEHYDAATADIVRHVYAEDFAAFGYAEDVP